MRRILQFDSLELDHNRFKRVCLQISDKLLCSNLTNLNLIETIKVISLKSTLTENRSIIEVNQRNSTEDGHQYGRSAGAAVREDSQLSAPKGLDQVESSLSQMVQDNRRL